MRSISVRRSRCYSTSFSSSSLSIRDMGLRGHKVRKTERGGDACGGGLSLSSRSSQGPVHRFMVARYVGRNEPSSDQLEPHHFLRECSLAERPGLNQCVCPPKPYSIRPGPPDRGCQPLFCVRDWKSKLTEEAVGTFTNVCVTRKRSSSKGANASKSMQGRTCLRRRVRRKLLRSSF